MECGVHPLISNAAATGLATTNNTRLHRDEETMISVPPSSGGGTSGIGLGGSVGGDELGGNVAPVPQQHSSSGNNSSGGGGTDIFGTANNSSNATDLTCSSSPNVSLNNSNSNNVQLNGSNNSNISSSNNGNEGGGGGGVVAVDGSDQAQFEADKRAVYKHPLFPLLALLFERCELATQSSEPQSSDAFGHDIQAFVQHQERDRKPFLADEPEIDGLMIKAIQVLRIHLLELEKVQELCKDFCNRYITCLKGKMQSENLLRSDYPQGGAGSGSGPLGATLTNTNGTVMMSSSMENLNNNSGAMMTHSDSGGSASTSPIQYSMSPSQTMAPLSTDSLYLLQNTNHYNNSGAMQITSNAVVGAGGEIGTNQTSGSNTASPISPSSGGMVVHGSTPIGQIGAGLCMNLSAANMVQQQQQPAQQQQQQINENSGPLSPSAPTTPGDMSADDCDSNDYLSRGGGGSGGVSGGGGSGRKQKRGVLPKHATGVMRSWLFQHLVHPYPTEDEKRHIAAQTNLTLLQVNNWFINARRRILQPMLDASVPLDGVSGTAAPSQAGSGVNSLSSPTHNSTNRLMNHKKKKPSNNNNNNNNNNHHSNRRYWPSDFQSIPQQLDSGMLSSSDDEDDEDEDSYSSDGDGGNLVIDASVTATTGGATPLHEVGVTPPQNGHLAPPPPPDVCYSNSSDL